LLAFDEMMVNNPADAMILSRLFEKLLDRGVRVIATSNRPPQDLYKDGLNRELFLPFIAILETRFEVVEVNGPTDYRLDRLTGVEVWHVPNTPPPGRCLPRPRRGWRSARRRRGPCAPSPRLGRAADADHRNAAGELGQPLLQLLAVVVGGGLLDLRLDLGDAALDVGLLAGAVDDRGVLLVDGDASWRGRACRA
jgi:hypothetical protein